MDVELSLKFELSKSGVENSVGLESLKSPEYEQTWRRVLIVYTYVMKISNFIVYST